MGKKEKARAKAEAEEAARIAAKEAAASEAAKIAAEEAARVAAEEAAAAEAAEAAAAAEAARIAAEEAASAEAARIAAEEAAAAEAARIAAKEAAIIEAARIAAEEAARVAANEAASAEAAKLAAKEIAAAEAARITADEEAADNAAKIAAEKAAKSAAEDAARLAEEDKARVAAAIDGARRAAEEADVSDATKSSSAVEAAAEKVSNIDNRKKEQDLKQESQPIETQKVDIAGEKADLFHLYIHKARKLENKDILGKSDPYIHVRFGPKEVRSPTVHNTLNPEWRFHTDFIMDETSPESVEIKIFDDDFGKSDPLGKLTLDLEGFKKGKQIQHEWRPLDGAVTGEVQVSLLRKELPHDQLKSQDNKEENKETPHGVISSPG